MSNIRSLIIACASALFCISLSFATSAPTAYIGFGNDPPDRYVISLPTYAEPASVAVVNAISAVQRDQVNAEFECSNQPEQAWRIAADVFPRRLDPGWRLIV